MIQTSAIAIHSVEEKTTRSVSQN